VSLAGLALRHRAALYLCIGLLAAGGVWALATLPAGIYPEVTYPRIAVVARGGTFEAEEMTIAVTRPLEQAVSGIVDLRRIRARTVRCISRDRALPRGALWPDRDRSARRVRESIPAGRRGDRGAGPGTRRRDPGRGIGSARRIESRKGCRAAAGLIGWTNRGPPGFVPRARTARGPVCLIATVLLPNRPRVPPTPWPR